MKYIFETAPQEGLRVDLEGCLIQMEAGREWFGRRILPLSVDQLRWRPSPGGWSIAECLAHLNATLSLYIPKIEEAVDRGWRESKTLRECSRLDDAESDALKRVEPPATIRIPAPPSVAPVAAVDPDWLVDQFRCTRERYEKAVRMALGLDLPHIPIAEPVHPRIRSLGGTLEFLAAHDRRHMWQAEQVRNAPGFPHSPLTSRLYSEGAK